ncbi:acetylglutamate kinase [Pseudenhygromyxa sp. WMMC2535]|uniref:acetylglutamate kinase n=1 Tax=Pseudenhygromyxa sp. WMMC2535 TaxID=2712867 RepID=UPI0015573F31|nr:acetylglutamate kinase [Pseudenhygromyxa sp. WMMC2535]NVB42542.1 acetylglutamate kinase [Pseudenhygromyxa sp. WMMC2535]
MSDTRVKAVLKFGGEVIADEARLNAVLEEVAALRARGWRFVLCHGGGPQATQLGERLGLEAIKVAGQRVTDAATLDVVCQAIAGGVSCRVVAAARAQGVPALGISAGVVHGQRRPPVAVASEGGRVVDYGFVGDVTAVDVTAIEACWAAERTPVLNPIGICGEPAGLLNINADTVAASVAMAVAADHLFSMTSVPGVLRERSEPSSRIPALREPEARAAIASGVIAGGMIPKVEEALAALAGGVGAVHILAAESGALAGEANAAGSRGTVLLPAS